MKNIRANPKADDYIRRAGKWQGVMKKLRAILLDLPLKEEVKWGKPCYTVEDANVVLIVGFKEYCALLFAKGALLKDPQGILVRPTENTQAARQIRFTHARDVDRLKRSLRAYVQNAIEVQKAGLDVKYKKTADFKVPPEVKRKLAALPGLKSAFAALTPGRQRGYILYFSAAKQAKTRESRVEKCMPKILQGKGLMDR